MKGRTIALAVVLTTMTMIFAACSGGDDEADIKEALQAYLDAAQQGDFSEAYTFLSEECRDQVSREDFDALLTVSLAAQGEDTVILKDVRVVEIAGETAIVQPEIVIVSNGDEMAASDEDDVLTELAKEDGKWRLNECAAFGSEDETIETSTPTAVPLGDEGSAEPPAQGVPVATEP